MTDIVAVVGDAPGSGCGMGDFVGVMNAELEKLGLTSGVVLTPNLHLSEFPRIRRELTRLAPRLIHFQFPSMSLGKDPIVSFLPWAYRGAPWLVSLCELSVFHPLRQLSLVPLSFTFDGYIFTSQSELDHSGRRNPRIRARSAIIPAISNIPSGTPAGGAVDPAQRLARVVYFGQLVPNRGIEEFLALARLSRDADAGLRFILMGATPEWARDYWQRLLHEARAAGCESAVNASDAEVAHILRTAGFGYFPYPDGASLKRGTLPAALDHGMLLLTCWSTKTESDIRAATIEAPTPEAALSTILRLRAEPARRADQEERIAAFNRKYSLEAIVQQYLDFYRQFCPGLFAPGANVSGQAPAELVRRLSPRTGAPLRSDR